MSSGFLARFFQPKAAPAGVPSTRPTLLDARDLSRVAGGLPRGGSGWGSPNSVVVGEDTAPEQPSSLPRGGGGWQ
jgi:hypothetical protein